MKDYKSAIDSYNKFLSVYSQHVEAREGLASAYLLNNQPDKSAIEYEKIYNDNPNDFKDFVNYGLALFESKNYDKSVQMLEKAISLDPDNTSARVYLAQAYVETDKDDLALAQYETVF